MKYNDHLNIRAIPLKKVEGEEISVSPLNKIDFYLPPSDKIGIFNPLGQVHPILPPLDSSPRQLYSPQTVF